MELSMENQELADILRRLNDVIRPNEEPSPEFRARLDSRLQDEWNRSMRASNIVKLERQRFIRQVGVAAVLIFAVGIATYFLSFGTSGEIEGTAQGPNVVPVVGLLGVVALVLVGVLYIANKRK